MMVRGPALAATVLGTLVSAACTIGAPPGFSSGDSWAFPLVGPLEDGALLVPVKIDGNGPFLFLIDPDAPMTSIDEDLAAHLHLYQGIGRRMLDETDHSHPVKVGSVGALSLGNLTVRRVLVAIHKPGTFTAAGRELAGILGRDVLADSLVFAFDRDAGMGYLATRDAFTAPETAIRLTYRDVALELGSAGIDRRVVTAQVNGTARSLHLDLGGAQSQLRPGLWQAAHLTPLPYRTTLVDEAGTARAIDKAGIANQVTVGTASAMGVLMVPYADQRTDPEYVDGSLGLNFFAPYNVWADWSGRSIYLKPRDSSADKLAVRLARWSSPVLAACAHPGCVTAARVADGSATPPPVVGSDGELELPPVELEVVRDPGAEDLIYEVTLEAVDGGGQPLGLPRLVATLPRGAMTIRQKVSPAFADARFRVVDVSPFVRGCRQPGGCVFELTLAR